MGFLWWNWAPARVFLGDVGSATLGYLVGFLLIKLAAAGFLVAAFLLPLYFVADATITLFRRLLGGTRIWEPHRDHAYQCAVQCGMSHSAVVSVVSAVNLTLILLVWYLSDYMGALVILSLGISSEERRVGKEWVSTCRSRWSRFT